MHPQQEIFPRWKGILIWPEQLEVLENVGVRDAALDVLQGVAAFCVALLRLEHEVDWSKAFDPQLLCVENHQVIDVNTAAANPDTLGGGPRSIACVGLEEGLPCGSLERVVLELASAGAQILFVVYLLAFANIKLVPLKGLHLFQGQPALGHPLVGPSFRRTAKYR